ncbi:MAG: tetratricopeptide repeat protein [Elusimicrobia bacterium]|nr:tetratricopeptide repeat protein [Elusimicrobiota bacterium]
MKNMRIIAAAVLALSVSGIASAQQSAEEVAAAETVAAAVPAAETPVPAEPAPALVPEQKPVQHQKLSINLDKLAQAQWTYFDKQFDEAKKDKGESLSYLLSDVNAWLSINSDKKDADKVLELKAKIQNELKDYRGAILTYIKHIYAYPNSNVNLTVRSQLAGLVDAKAGKLKGPVNAIAKGSSAEKKSDRLASMLEQMSGETSEFFYQALVQEFVDFSADYPDYPSADKLQRCLAGVFVSRNQPLAAVMAYSKLLSVYPASSMKASVRMDIAAVLSDKLKNYDQAIEIYQDVTNEHPGTPEAAQSYVRIGELSELRKKFSLAVSVYDKIIALYPKSDSAYNAFEAKARIQRKELAMPKEAYDTLNAQADMFKGEARAIKAMLLASEVAQKDIKDFKLSADALDRIAAEYPSSKEAPVALLDEGDIYSEHLGNKDKAKELYERVVGGYAGNSNAKTAQKRIDSLMKQ